MPKHRSLLKRILLHRTKHAGVNLASVMKMAPSWDLADIKKDLLLAHRECSSRGLLHGAKWSAELAYSLQNVKADLTEVLGYQDNQFVDEIDSYLLAKSYFDLREYDRTAHFVENCKSKQCRFLHFYSRYLSSEKKKNDDLSDSIAPVDTGKNVALQTLRSELQLEHSNSELDGFGLYLYGVVLKKLELLSEAVTVLLEAISKQPLHWGAWQELATLVTDKDMLTSLVFPNHWMKEFFIAHTSLELQLNDDALDIYNSLKDNGFTNSTYIMAQIAIAFHNMRDVDQAVDVFRHLQKIDPCRLDNMDTYSNLLYVKEMRVELSYLAHHTCEIDKYRVETCCVIGNYYSLRSQHEKAVLYFQRALKLNPHYLSAWTLMGHEFMEMKNTAAAIQSYRQAIEVNRRDYRAWYGLGQTYEILKMPYYCLYYYRQAQQLRPNDSRMLVALGESYEKLERLQEAKKCFWKAHSVGDIEGMALIKLAKLYAKLGEETQAAAAYTNYIQATDENGITDRDEQCHAYKYLANYYIKLNRLDEAYKNAQKCTEYNETKEEAKSLLRHIAQLRSQQDSPLGGGGDVMIEDSASTSNNNRFRGRPDNSNTPASNPCLSPINLTFTPS